MRLPSDPPAIVIQAEVARHEEVHRELKRLTRAMNEYWLLWATFAREAIEKGYHVQQGYASAEEYFEAEFQTPYRSVFRRTSVANAIAALPAEVQDHTRETLIKAGVAKAGILAPLLRKQPDGWADLVEAAPEILDGPLQERVNVAMGRPAHSHKLPGERFRQMVLRYIPPDQQERVERVWRAMDEEEIRRRGGGYQNPIDSFLLMIVAAEVELAAKGIEW